MRGAARLGHQRQVGPDDLYNCLRLSMQVTPSQCSCLQYSLLAKQSCQTARSCCHQDVVYIVLHIAQGAVSMDAPAPRSCTHHLAACCLPDIYARAPHSTASHKAVHRKEPSAFAAQAICHLTQSMRAGLYPYEMVQLPHSCCHQHPAAALQGLCRLP